MAVIRVHQGHADTLTVGVGLQTFLGTTRNPSLNLVDALTGLGLNRQRPLAGLGVDHTRIKHHATRQQRGSIQPYGKT